jgi:hypothetical protein
MPRRFSLFAAVGVAVLAFSVPSPAQVSPNFDGLSRFPSVKLVDFPSEASAGDREGRIRTGMHATLLRKLPESFSHSHWEPFVALAAGTYVLGSLDMHQTIVNTIANGGGAAGERNPLARPLLELPHPLYYVTGYALITGVNWISWKMRHSNRWHKVWWIPQACTMSGNIWGYATSRSW